MGEHPRSIEELEEMARSESENLPLKIERAEVDISAALSSGPGGQSVNKTSTKAVLKWNFMNSDLVGPVQQELLKAKLASRVNKAGEIVVHVSDSRSLSSNEDMALFRLNELVNAALKPKKKRRPTKKGRGVQARERRERELLKQKKAGRKKVSGRDY
ncbi:aminoacyl-tRNA hydrolase [Patescibacteria group bacterium]|nr:aminoacyl-tRNA hydrolase [Patescibacteria group bacterium]MBU1907334.1 aminoacyl-tRNA hydrolase [Patescibacteria group bacterium]